MAGQNEGLNTCELTHWPCLASYPRSPYPQHPHADHTHAHPCHAGETNKLSHAEAGGRKVAEKCWMFGYGECVPVHHYSDRCTSITTLARPRQASPWHTSHAHTSDSHPPSLHTYPPVPHHKGKKKKNPVLTQRHPRRHNQAFFITVLTCFPPPNDTKCYTSQRYYSSFLEVVFRDNLHRNLPENIGWSLGGTR